MRLKAFSSFHLSENIPFGFKFPLLERTVNRGHPRAQKLYRLKRCRRPPAAPRRCRPHRQAPSSVLTVARTNRKRPPRAHRSPPRHTVKVTANAARWRPTPPWRLPPPRACPSRPGHARALPSAPSSPPSTVRDLPSRRSHLLGSSARMTRPRDEHTPSPRDTPTVPHALAAPLGFTTTGNRRASIQSLTSTRRHRAPPPFRDLTFVPPP